MKVTILCALVLIAALFLMIWVALVQEKKLFTTAPKDIQAAAKGHAERFTGARILVVGEEMFHAYTAFPIVKESKED